MAKQNDYITATRKNFVSNDNEERIVEKCIVEIQGTFLVKIRDNAFNGNIGENAFKHIDKFLEVVGPIKINGLIQDRFRLSVFFVSLAGTIREWFTKECIGLITTWDNMVEMFVLKFHHLSDHDEEEETEEDGNLNKTDNDTKIFKIEGNLFDFETPFYENFHELDYDVLVKLQECWWKVNAYEIAPFTRMENFRRGPYADMKTKKTGDPYLDVSHIFGRNYEASNVSNTQENQGHKEHMDNLTPEPSNCKIRRFKMMKYSFNDDEVYITIKESGYLNHSKDSLDAYRELLRLIDEGWVVTTPDG
ncbi:hypothetical protein Tco_1280843 [Tanacetum coccineum]